MRKSYKPTKEQRRAWRIAEDLRSGAALPPETKSSSSVYKEPLTPVADGYGYFGAVTRDKSGDFIQCHICGYFYQSISGHVRAHEMTASAYRDLVGLARKTKLTGNTLYFEQRKKGLKLAHEIESDPVRKAKRDENLAKGDVSHKDYQPYPLERRNKLGICPEQSLTMVLKLAEKLGHTPSRTDFVREYGYKGKTPLF